MNRFLKLTGFSACVVAVLMMNGGHWLALQSFAWSRMLVNFSRQGSVGMAIMKTFDGQHPCALCLRARDGWRKEQGRSETLSWEKPDKMPELLWELRYAAVPPVPTLDVSEQPSLPSLFWSFVESPPTPPPRRRSAVL